MRHCYSYGIFLLCIVLTLAGCGNDNKKTVVEDAKEQLPATNRIELPIEVRAVKLTSSDGLPDNSIRKIYQDSKGFIWFATLNGLSRYDGRRFVNYYKQDKGLSLQDNRIFDMKEDRNGFLWIKTTSHMNSCYDVRHDCFVDFTGKGNYRCEYNLMTITDSCGVWFYDGRTGTMRVNYADGHFSSETYGEAALGSAHVHFAQEGESKKVWLGTNVGLHYWQNGKLTRCLSGVDLALSGRVGSRCVFVTVDGKVYMEYGNGVRKIADIPLDKDEGILSLITFESKIRVFTTQGSYEINNRSGVVKHGEDAWNIANATVYIDNKGGHWLFNKTGTVYMVDGEQLKKIEVMSTQRLGYVDIERYSIVRDEHGLVWISTYGNGLFVYDPVTEAVQHITAGTDNDSPITSNYLQSLMVDRTGSVWVSSEYSGVSHLFVVNKGVKRVYPESEIKLDRTNTVRLIQRMPDGDIVVGNRAGGLYLYNSDLSVMKEKQSYDVNIYAITRKNGESWIGTREKGLIVGNHKYVSTDDTTSLSNNKIFCMLQDSHGHVWIGTLGGGLNLAVQSSDGTLTFKRIIWTKYNQREVRCLYEDKNGYIWVGTSAGVFIFDPTKLEKNPQAYYYYNAENSDMTTEEVRYIYQDSKGLMWLAMPGGGVVYCKVNGKDYAHLVFNTYSQKDGLVNNMVQAMIEDSDGRMWISTEYGV